MAQANLASSLRGNELKAGEAKVAEAALEACKLLLVAVDL